MNDMSKRWTPDASRRIWLRFRLRDRLSFYTPPCEKWWLRPDGVKKKKKKMEEGRKKKHHNHGMAQCTPVKKQTYKHLYKLTKKKRNLLAFRFHYVKEKKKDIATMSSIQAYSLLHTHTHSKYIHSAGDTPACRSSEECVLGNLVLLDGVECWSKSWTLVWLTVTLIRPYWWTGHEARHSISIWLIWLDVWQGRFGVCWFWTQSDSRTPAPSDE